MKVKEKQKLLDDLKVINKTKIVDELVRKYSNKIYTKYGNYWGDPQFNIRTIKGIANAAGIESECVWRSDSDTFIYDISEPIDPYYAENTFNEECNRIEIEYIYNYCLQLKKKYN